MNHFRYPLYASSRASPQSKWMPWELGYFDGRRSGRLVGEAPTAATGVRRLGIGTTRSEVEEPRVLARS